MGEKNVSEVSACNQMDQKTNVLKSEQENWVKS